MVRLIDDGRPKDGEFTCPLCRCHNNAGAWPPTVRCSAHGPVQPIKFDGEYFEIVKARIERELMADNQGRLF